MTTHRPRTKTVARTEPPTPAEFASIATIIPARGPVPRVVLWVYDFGGDKQCKNIGPVFTSAERALREQRGQRKRDDFEIVTLAEYVRRRGKLLLNNWRVWDIEQRVSVHVAGPTKSEASGA